MKQFFTNQIIKKMLLLKSLNYKVFQWIEHELQSQIDLASNYGSAALSKSVNPNLQCVKIREPQFSSQHEVSYYQIEVLKTAVLLRLKKNVVICIFHQINTAKILEKKLSSGIQHFRFDTYMSCQFSIVCNKLPHIQQFKTQICYLMVYMGQESWVSCRALCSESYLAGAMMSSEV